MKKTSISLPIKPITPEQMFLNQFISQNISEHHNPYSRFGYRYFGPMLFGFVAWLHERLVNEHIKKIYFLARDAKIIMEAYKLLYGKEHILNYLQISRKSIILTEIDNASSFDELYEMLKSILKETAKVKDFYQIINANANLYEDKLIYKLTLKQKEEIFQIISSRISQYAKSQKELLQKYLKQNDFSSKVALVDIGYHGTIQYILTKTNPKVDIHGYYFGVNLDRNFKEYDSLNRTGYLFNNTSYNSNQSAISLNVGLFETMFLTQQGSTVGYKQQKEKVVPIRDSSHKVDANIFKIQRSALAFVTDAKASDRFKEFSKFAPETLFSNFKYIATHPQMSIINLFRRVNFEAHNKDILIKHHSFLFYIFHLKQFSIDFNNSYCKVMFFKDVLRLPLPYYKILNYLYKKAKI